MKSCTLLPCGWTLRVSCWVRLVRGRGIDTEWSFLMQDMTKYNRERANAHGKRNAEQEKWTPAGKHLLGVRNVLYSMESKQNTSSNQVRCTMGMAVLGLEWEEWGRAPPACWWQGSMSSLVHVHFLCSGYLSQGSTSHTEQNGLNKEEHHWLKSRTSRKIHKEYTHQEVKV